MSGIRCDFAGQYADQQCPLGCGKDDTLENVLSCTTLAPHIRNNSVANNIASFESKFSHDIVQQKEITELCRQLLEIRAKILSNWSRALHLALQKLCILSYIDIYSIIFGNKTTTTTDEKRM